MTWPIRPTKAVLHLPSRVKITFFCSLKNKTVMQSHHDNGGGGDGGGASVDYYFWATGVPSAKRVMPAVDSLSRKPSAPTVWQPLPQAWFDEYLLRGSTIEHSYRGQDNWHLADMGQGAIVFEVNNTGGGLVIGLTGWNHNDIQGYYVVLDDDKHESYVLRVSRLGNDGLLRQNVNGEAMASGRRSYVRVPGTFSDPSFRLNFSTPQRFWLLYQRGVIIVGQGDAPGVGKQILYMPTEPGRNDSLLPGADLYHYGFGRIGVRWNGNSSVANTQSYKYMPTALIPMPANQLAMPFSGSVMVSQPPPPGNSIGSGVLYSPTPTTPQQKQMQK